MRYEVYVTLTIRFRSPVEVRFNFDDRYNALCVYEGLCMAVNVSSVSLIESSPHTGDAVLQKKDMPWREVK
jgi:hypothetical protein